jgi:hypothetical protein
MGELATGPPGKLPPVGIPKLGSFVKSFPPEGPSSKGFISSGFISRGPGSPPGPPNTPSDCMSDGGSSLTMKYASEISNEDEFNQLLTTN